nr:MAG TPA: hypothetical protein [Caudoviricetes sp.]
MVHPRPVTLQLDLNEKKSKGSSFLIYIDW